MVRRAGRWAAALATHREQTTATLGAVGIQPPSTIQLLSPEAPLPVWVRNDLPYPVNVVLYAEPDDPRLVVTPQTRCMASADANTRVQVPVEARVGSGEVVIELRLLSPSGCRDRRGPVGRRDGARATGRPSA